MDTNGIQKYIEKRLKETGISILTIDDLNKFIAEWMEIKNNQPLEHFEGYSPIEMQFILCDLFGVNCPVRLSSDYTDDDCNSVPLFRQVKILLELIKKEENLKLTQTGNLPVRIVKEVQPVGASEPYIENGIVKLRTENASTSVQMAKIALQLMNAVKKRNNSLSLTKTGKELLKDHRKLLSQLLTTMFTKFNTGYFDNYLSENIGALGTGFSLILLNKYGETDQLDTFYSQKYFNAFPKLQEEVLEKHMPQKKIAFNCYSLRIFHILFYHLGLVSIEETDKYEPTGKTTIHRNDLFEKLFIIQTN